jgi:hypothetical protein
MRNCTQFGRFFTEENGGLGFSLLQRVHHYSSIALAKNQDRASRPVCPDQRTTTGKQPYCFEVGDSETFAFAGLWEQWRSPDGTLVQTCAILTTTANETMSGVHDRMPVILSPDNYDLWLDPGVLQYRRRD